MREINGLEDRVWGHLQVPHLVATETVSDRGEEFWTTVQRKSVRSAEPSKAAVEWF